MGRTLKETPAVPARFPFQAIPRPGAPKSKGRAKRRPALATVPSAGYNAALTVLAVRVPVPPGVFRSCHQITMGLAM